MTYLRWITVLALAAAPLAACDENNDDTVDGDDSAGRGGSNAGSGGSSANAGSGGTAGSSGSPASAGSGGNGSTVDAGSGGDAGEGRADVIDTAVAAGSFSQLAEALTAANLVDALQGDGPFTVFAPTDDAFDAFEEANPGVLASLTTQRLTEILTYHVLGGAAVTSSDLRDGLAAETLAGAPVLIDLSGDDPKINDATITTADIEASNGVIHVIDAILLPPEDDIVATAVAAGDFTALAGALTDANLVETLQGDGPFTVFAPTDAAFAELAAVPTGDALESVLLYHVVSGAIGSGNLRAGEVETLSERSVTIALDDGVTVNDATVTTANILTRNGIIHVIDKVLIPTE
jgi:transforming growth factor-beta-induced protein